jgi:hypothetical protein
MNPKRGCRCRDLQELLKKTPISGGSHPKLGWLRERDRHEENHDEDVQEDPGHQERSHKAERREAS